MKTIAMKFLVTRL